MKNYRFIMSLNGEGLYTNWISVLNVNDNIIRMNMWILCEFNRIVLLWFHSSMLIVDKRMEYSTV
jgi:hypothetical protein